MDEILLEFMKGTTLLVIYAIVLGSALLENIFPPFPSDTILLFGGVLAGERFLNPFIILLLRMLGSIAGSICIYVLGRRKGREFFLRKDFPFFPKKRIIQLEDLFKRHGGKIILVNKFFAGFRSVFFLAAGIGLMKMRRMLLYGLISSVIWSGFLLTIGYIVGTNLGVVRKYLYIYSSSIFAIVTLVTFVAIVRYGIIFYKNKRKLQDSVFRKKIDLKHT